MINRRAVIYTSYYITNCLGLNTSVIIVPIIRRLNPNLIYTGYIYLTDILVIHLHIMNWFEEPHIIQFFQKREQLNRWNAENVVIIDEDIDCSVKSVEMSLCDTMQKVL